MVGQEGRVRGRLSCAGVV